MDPIFNTYDESIKSRYNVDLVGGVAERLVERWGLLTATDDGEDSAGRSKLRLETPDEVVTRAFAIAKAFVSKLQEGNHLKDLGPLTERRLLMQGVLDHRIVGVKDGGLLEEIGRK